MTEPLFPIGAAVQHAQQGRGRVVGIDEPAILVRFDTGIHSCRPDELKLLQDVAAPGAVQPGDAASAVLRALSVAIRSTNDTWGVFSNSRIDLLPHQLWVCRKVLERWPTRWLVADDVGLGKTIEAGLILTPLLSSGRVRRLLVLAPAALVDQWQERLRLMFDIRLAKYASEADGPRADFWGTHHLVVASAQTLRADHNGRRARILEAQPWDLVLVDEAHHLNKDERSGPTLGWELLQQMQERQLIESLVFFTGTPHRGKDFGFLALLQLLRPDEFDPQRPTREQLPLLRDVMIRNNKRRVTNMTGAPLFQRVAVSTEEYRYSDTERRFYDLLTEYIVTGRAWASSLAPQEQRTAMLVLIAMQKLASSSVAAIRRALRNRLRKLRAASADREREQELRRTLEQLTQRDDPADADVRAALEEQVAELATDTPIGPHELPGLEELLAAASAVTEETKVRRIIELLEARFADRSVLFFTEYKATQSLLLSALRARFGDDCATFINGDGRAQDVARADGTIEALELTREEASRRFNEGEVRFLVSTEAAGEGVDLQRACHTLIHVDLPWNPMRLHQRVGRIDRYGQQRPVEVLSLRNPETVEARIWDCLNEKLERITAAFAAGMDDPEDMLQLVLGMSSGTDYERIFADAPRTASGSELSRWFDAKTATFGGERAVDFVKALVGNVARFDFGTDAAGLPKADLPDLEPFFRLALANEGRKVEEREGGLSFLTPDEWTKGNFAIARRYDGVRFRRSKPGEGGGDIAGVGHKLFDLALKRAEAAADAFAAVPDLTDALAVFVVRDAFTTAQSTIRTVVVGVAGDSRGWRLLRDWEIVQHLNRAAERPVALARTPSLHRAQLDWPPHEHVKRAREWLVPQLGTLGLPFHTPRVDAFALLAPAIKE